VLVTVVGGRVGAGTSVCIIGLIGRAVVTGRVVVAGRVEVAGRLGLRDLF